jgi:hypothetical protein
LPYKGAYQIKGHPTMAYNGWKNYETWNVALWIDNEQGTHQMRQHWTEDTWNESVATNTFTRLESATAKLADKIKIYVEENNPLDGQASMYNDLLGAAISEVDWHEIASNWLEEIAEGE